MAGTGYMENNNQLAEDFPSISPALPDPHLHDLQEPPHHLIYAPVLNPAKEGV